MEQSHINFYWKDLDSQLSKYVDRYFNLRFGNVSEEEKSPLRKNEKGALTGYLQTFDDKNNKWIERLNCIKDKISERYLNLNIEEPDDLRNLNFSNIENLNVEKRITIPLKALYKLSYHELLDNNEPIITYDENGEFDKINLSEKNLKSAINLFALTGALANRIAHASTLPDELFEAYEIKHQMIAYLITAVYDYNTNAKEKISCKFAKLPSKSDGHSYPTFTIRLSSPEDLGKISLHFGGSKRCNANAL